MNLATVIAGIIVFGLIGIVFYKLVVKLLFRVVALCQYVHRAALRPYSLVLGV